MAIETTRLLLSESRQVKIHGLLLLTCLCLACGACKQSPETLVEGGYDEAEMDAAIARARGEVDKFIQNLSEGDGENFAVKAPIEDQGQVEHFWLIDVRFADGSFTGIIDNEPGIVSNVKTGQEWTLGKQEISDWMFVRDGKMYGNYTMRPLLKTMPEDQANQLRQMLAEP